VAEGQAGQVIEMSRDFFSNITFSKGNNSIFQ